MAMGGNARVSHAAEPGTELRAVTKSDSTSLLLATAPASGAGSGEKRWPRALWVGGAGNLSLIAVDDSAAVTITGVAAGSIIPIRCQKVMDATTATDIVAIY